MIIRKVIGGDWTFGQGLGNYNQDEAAIDENIQTRLLSWVGDCFFALQDGVDWSSRLDVGQQTALEDEVRSVILASFGVVAVNSVIAVFDGTTRLFSLNYNIDTIFSASFQAQLKLAIGVT